MQAGGNYHTDDFSICVWISMVTGKKYENIKIFFDVFYIIIAAVICLVFLGRLEGVREGSIFAAIAVGSIIKFYNGIFDKVKKR